MANSITRTYSFANGGVADGGQVDFEFQNIVNTINNADAGTTTWTQVKVATLTSTTTTKLKGSATNDAAAAGDIGEYIESNVTAVNVGATGAWNDLTSISLTAGDWDVTLIAGMNAVGSFTNFAAGISTAGVAGNSFTDAVDTKNSISTTDNIANPNRDYIVVPVYRVSLAATTTIYAKQQATYAGATPSGRGRLSARRVR